jgi:phage tail tape-measure protein
MARAKKTPLARAKGTEHVLDDVGTIGGALTGAIIGSVGGGLGVIVGSAIGAAIGKVAGTVLDRDSHEGEKHDHELDDAIGVTAGDLGARDIVRDSFAAEKARVEAHRRAIEADLVEAPAEKN